MAGRLRHIDQTPLTAAVQGARKRPLLDAWAWNRKDATTDITPLVAVTLAMHGHAQTVASRAAAGEPSDRPGLIPGAVTTANVDPSCATD
jgi:hypothetical protein